jgi:hypothetical protein
MPAHSESVIIQDPEILSGEPVFRGTRSLSKHSWTTWKAETLWMSSWSNIQESGGWRGFNPWALTGCRTLWFLRVRV